MGITDISYDFINMDGRCTTIRFDFKIDGIKKTSYLQLPDCGDSEHQIDDCCSDYDIDNETHVAIFKACKDHYYNDFEDTDLAAASALLGRRVESIEEGDDTLLAIDESGEKVEVVESIYAGYYNVTMFEFPDNH